MRLRATPDPLRPRRALAAALLCAGLVATSLPFGQGVAHAAADDVSIERLAGPTRYETAVAVAERYADTVSAGVSTAIVVPGADSHAACALPAAAVAAQRQAPILLTPAGELPSAVEAFIEDHGIGHAVILGGTAAVSTAVADRLQQLTGRASQRLGGANCAEAALAAARHLGSAGVAAGRGRTALLATDASPADGLAAGPVAYRGRLPLLLAHDGEVDDPVFEYLGDHVDHVIILGGTAAVSEAAERQIQALEVTTERWHGADRYATAARVAHELLGERSPAACFGGDGVGLATGFAAADATASAPLLGERCDPLLLTEPSTLPPQTANALRADAVGGDETGMLRLTLFGGIAAVGPAVERAAAAAATDAGTVSGPPVFARISASEGACHWTVTFGEPVRTADAEDIGNYTFDQEPLPARLADIDGGEGTTTTQAVVLLAGAGPYSSADEPTGCATPIAVRDRLGIVGSAIRAADGPRTVAPNELIVRADTTRPRLSVLAPPGGQTVWVRSSEPLAADSVTVTLHRGRARRTATASIDDGDTSFSLTFSFPEHDAYKPATDLPFTQPPWLHPGDRITVPASKLRDRAGNANASVVHTIAADTTAPRAVLVSLASAAPRADGSVAVDVTVRWSEPVQGCGLGPGDETMDLGNMQIDVEGDGFADYSLDGSGAAAAGVTFIDAPDGNPWILPGTAACDQSWRESVGTLVVRLAAGSPDVLPRNGSSLLVHAGSAYDFAGNPSQSHAASLIMLPPLRR